MLVFNILTQVFPAVKMRPRGIAAFWRKWGPCRAGAGQSQR